jgi:hypothetical protein
MSVMPPLRAVTLSALLGLAAVQPAAAADQRGQYAARGQQAALTCGGLAQITKAGGAPLAATIAWIDGVLTGVNMVLPNTFDISPYRGSPITAAMVIQRCAASPNAPVHVVLFQVINSLAPLRAQADSPVITMSVGQQNLGIRQDTLKLVQQALIQRGFLRTQRIDGLYTERVRAALKEFQKSENLPQTEIADPDTVQRLLRR